ncbi:MAG: hypothetical protein H6700_10905, partial [Myxococcales bacterium]|nr:hypothetical protein [Myxococcales bacterium]
MSRRESSYRRLRALAALALGLGLGACDEPLPGDDAGDIEVDSGRTPSRDGGSDTVTEAGLDAALDSALDSGTDAPDEVGADAALDEPDAVGVDAQPDGPTVDPNDHDGDGYVGVEWGGDDCDDTDRRISPGVREVCDYLDNDCSGSVNDGISCLIYAHTPDELFEIDPFAGTARQITSVPTLYDFDTDGDGTLWGIGSRTLYRYDAGARRWDTVSSLSTLATGVNGFAIDSAGNGYITGGSDLYRLDLSTGNATRVGSFGGSYVSSGDCVVDKSDVIYMTSTGPSSDILVRIDGGTGVATPVGSGIGFSSVFGLTSAWGYLFGVTSGGDLI